MTETLLDSKHSNLIPVSSRCPGASHSSYSARISLPSSPRVCVRASLQRVHREVTNQQQGRDDKAEGAAAAAAVFHVSLICKRVVFFFNSALARALARQVNVHMRAPCLSPLPSPVNTRTHTSTHALDIALASQCVQSCSSGRALLIPQPAM